MNVKWVRVENGEYNEQEAVINNHVVTLHSDRTGERWAFRVDGGDAIDLDSTGQHAAQVEVEKEIAQW